MRSLLSTSYTFARSEPGVALRAITRNREWMATEGACAPAGFTAEAALAIAVLILSDC